MGESIRREGRGGNRAKALLATWPLRKPAAASGPSAPEIAEASGNTASGENTVSDESMTMTAPGENKPASGETPSMSDDELTYEALGFHDTQVREFVDRVRDKAQALADGARESSLKALKKTAQAATALLAGIPTNTENAFRKKVAAQKNKLADTATSLQKLVAEVGDDKPGEDMFGSGGGMRGRAGGV